MFSLYNRNKKRKRCPRWSKKTKTFFKDSLLKEKSCCQLRFFDFPRVLLQVCLEYTREGGEKEGDWSFQIFKCLLSRNQKPGNATDIILRVALFRSPIPRIPRPNFISPWMEQRCWNQNEDKKKMNVQVQLSTTTTTTTTISQEQTQTQTQNITMFLSIDEVTQLLFLVFIYCSRSFFFMTANCFGLNPIRFTQLNFGCLFTSALRWGWRLEIFKQALQMFPFQHQKSDTNQIEFQPPQKQIQTQSWQEDTKILKEYEYGNEYGEYQSTTATSRSSSSSSFLIPIPLTEHTILHLQKFQSSLPSLKLNWCLNTIEYITKRRFLNLACWFLKVNFNTFFSFPMYVEVFITLAEYRWKAALVFLEKFLYEKWPENTIILFHCVFVSALRRKKMKTFFYLINWFRFQTSTFEYWLNALLFHDKITWRSIETMKQVIKARNKILTQHHCQTVFAGSGVPNHYYQLKSNKQQEQLTAFFETSQVWNFSFSLPSVS